MKNAVLKHIYVMCAAFIVGNPATLVYPTDYDGNVCGVGEMR